MFYRLFLFCIALGVSSLCFGQHTCGTDEIHRQRLATDAEYKKRHLENEALIYQKTLELHQERGAKGKTAGVVYTLPVVVHIVHPSNFAIGTEFNPSDDSVYQLINYLNQGFRKSAYPFNQPPGVDSEIEFCLAVRDVNGRPTNGIVRVANDTFIAQTYQLDMGRDIELKQNVSKQWNPFKYINIWMVKDASGNAGYATFPALLGNTHGGLIDGIVVLSKFISSGQSNAPLLIHELGHYFNLFHTFQNGCKNNNCLLEGDLVCDTPRIVIVGVFVFLKIRVK